MNRFHSLHLIIAMLLLLLIGSGCLQAQHTPGLAEPTPVSGHDAMKLVLGNVTNATQDALFGLDAPISEAAAALGKTGLSGPASDAVLAKLAASHPAIMNVITYDLNGTVRAAEPGDAKVLLNKSLMSYEIVRKAIMTQEPLMSDLLTLAEGGEGAVITYPIFSADGNFTGIVSTAYSPYALVAPIADEAMKNSPYTCTVAQTDGRIIYDPDPEEVGRETFNETLFADFPEIIELAHLYKGNRSGYDTYSFYNTGFGKVVSKETFWSTAGLHGTEWRILMIGEL